MVKHTAFSGWVSGVPLYWSFALWARVLNLDLNFYDYPCVVFILCSNHFLFHHEVWQHSGKRLSSNICVAKRDYIKLKMLQSLIWRLSQSFAIEILPWAIMRASACFVVSSFTRAANVKCSFFHKNSLNPTLNTCSTFSIHKQKFYDSVLLFIYAQRSSSLESDVNSMNVSHWFLKKPVL